MSTTPDKASLEIKKQRNVAVVQLAQGDLRIVANHIYRTEVFNKDSGDNTEDKEKSYTFVEYKDETYSFNVLPIYNISLMEDVPRYVRDVNCIVFVVDAEKDMMDINDDWDNWDLICFTEDAQSISLLVITGCDRLMSQEEREEIVETAKGLCGRYQMRKGILPVCFADDDFHLSGPMKIIRQRKIKEDEDSLHSILCAQCDNPVLAATLQPPMDLIPSSAREYSERDDHFLDTTGIMLRRTQEGESEAKGEGESDKSKSKYDPEICQPLKGKSEIEGSTLEKEEGKSKPECNPELCQPLEFLDEMAIQPDITLKILILGDSAVGKSCFLTRLCSNRFDAHYSSTVGVDFHSRSLVINDQTVDLKFWDTAGQERFQSVTKAYYRGADGVILMYDITSEVSFNSVKKWIISMQKNMDNLLPTCILLVGNKVDLDSEREVLTETGEMSAKMYDAQFIETSAKTGYNVANACLTLVNRLLSETVLPSNSCDSNKIIVEKKSHCSC